MDRTRPSTSGRGYHNSVVTFFIFTMVKIIFSLYYQADIKYSSPIFGTITAQTGYEVVYRSMGTRLLANDLLL